MTLTPIPPSLQSLVNDVCPMSNNAATLSTPAVSADDQSASAHTSSSIPPPLVASPVPFSRAASSTPLSRSTSPGSEHETANHRKQEYMADEMYQAW